MSTSNEPVDKSIPRPRAWTRRDMENLGLPRFKSHELEDIRTELRDGAGFALVDDCVTTPDTDIQTTGKCVIRFGEALGHLLPQNIRAETLVEIADFSDEDDFDDRGYRSAGELTPHTDPPPMLALYCINAAKEGGENQLVSAEAIRTRFKEECPDLLSVLETGFTYFLPDEKIEGAGVFRGPIPALTDGPGGLSCVYYRPFIERAVKQSGIPLPPEQRRALDRFDAFSTDPDLQIRLTLEPGEALVLNNYRVLHARDAYTDWPEKSRRRRLLRMWLDADWMPDPPEVHAMRRNPMAEKLREAGKAGTD